MNKNIKLLLILCGIGLGMLGGSYAFVPMYNMFCKVLGIPTIEIAVGKAGKPKPMEVMEEGENRVITVRFMGQLGEDLPIKFKPVQRSVKIGLQEPVLVAYEAKNTSNNPITGVAVHTIVGQSSIGESQDLAEFVDLQQCFCFEEQLYPANQEINMPLSFHITKDLPKDVHTLMFGYTLYRQVD